MRRGRHVFSLSSIALLAAILAVVMASRAPAQDRNLAARVSALEQKVANLDDQVANQGQQISNLTQRIVSLEELNLTVNCAMGQTVASALAVAGGRASRVVIMSLESARKPSSSIGTTRCCEAHRRATVSRAHLPRARS